MYKTSRCPIERLVIVSNCVLMILTEFVFEPLARRCCSGRSLSSSAADILGRMKVSLNKKTPNRLNYFAQETNRFASTGSVFE